MQITVAYKMWARAAMLGPHYRSNVHVQSLAILLATFLSNRFTNNKKKHFDTRLFMHEFLLNFSDSVNTNVSLVIVN